MTNEEAVKILDELGGWCSNDREYVACNIAKEALEKQIQKKPKISIHGTTDHNTKVKCPVCGNFVAGKYCVNCGQRLDWSNSNAEIH